MTSEILSWFKNFTPEKCSYEDLLRYRQRLSISMTEIAKEIQQKSIEHKSTYAERKYANAESFLLEDGNIKERESKTIKKNYEIIKKENQLEGDLQGLKIYLNSLEKVDNAFSSWISHLRKI